MTKELFRVSIILCRDPLSVHTRLQTWHDVFKAPKYVCGPMVWQSERAFRVLVRTHGVGLCYTPMINAAKFLCSCPPDVLVDSGCIGVWKKVSDTTSSSETGDLYDDYKNVLKDLTTTAVRTKSTRYTPSMETEFIPTAADRPLILQFCSTTPDEFSDACRVASKMFSGYI